MRSETFLSVVHFFDESHTAPSEEMTQKALRGAVRHFPRVLKTIESTANLGEIAEQELLVPVDLETKINHKRRNVDDDNTG